MADDEQTAARKAYEQRSWAELEAGRLPLRAQERLATMAADHAFTSDLSVGEHHAIRSVGFVPVGQVMGASVFQIGWTGAWNCGIGYGGGLGGGYGGGYGPGTGLPGGFPGTRGGGGGFGGGGFNSGGFSGAGMGGIGAGAGSGYRVGAPGSPYTVSTVEVTPWKRSLAEAQQRAVGRMQQEAVALGGDGVVAVRFSEQTVTNNAVEFLVVGTAVRSVGATHPPGRLFSCDLSGQDFAQLVLAGYLPTSLLFGVAVMSRHDDWATRMNRGSWANVELGGYTQLSLDTRAEARLAFARQAASSGATHAVLASSGDQLSEHECAQVEGGRDHVLRATLIGTGVVDVGRRTAGHELPDALPILRLRDRRGAAVTETTR